MIIDHSGKKNRNRLPRDKVVKKTRQMECVQKLRNSISASSKVLIGIDQDDGDTELTEHNIDMLQNQLTELQNLITNIQNKVHAKRHPLPVKNSANSMLDGILKTKSLLVPVGPTQNITKVLIERNILTSELAKNKYDYFITNLNPCWPCLSLPKHCDYEWLVDNDPLLLLTLVTCTSLNEPPLHDVLLCHLEERLSLCVAGRQEVSFSHIQIYLLLSIWCSPPTKWGSYIHQIPLMMSLNLSLCLDLGNDAGFRDSRVYQDGSKERQIVRNFMGVYMSCGSLGLSVPRFKCVHWSPVHERYCQFLVSGDEVNDADKFLYFSSKLICLGEEIMNYINPNGFPRSQKSLVKDDELKNVMIHYERRMQSLAMDSGMFDYSTMRGNLLCIIYYQILMTMYDYVVCNGLISQESLSDETYSETINRLVKASEKVIESFVKLSAHQDTSFPTFFYYRPIHSLVSLIRVRLLVMSQHLQGVQLDVESQYEMVCQSLELIGEQHLVALKMAPILSRVSKWMQFSDSFNKSGVNNSVVDLLNELGDEINPKKKSNQGKLPSEQPMPEQLPSAVVTPTTISIIPAGSDTNPVAPPSPIGYSPTDPFVPLTFKLDQQDPSHEDIATLQMINGLFNKMDFEIMGNSSLDSDWNI